MCQTEVDKMSGTEVLQASDLTWNAGSVTALKEEIKRFKPAWGR